MIAKMKFAAGYLGLGLLLAACNGGGDGGTAPTMAELIGKWLLREVSTKGQMTMKMPPHIDTTTTWDSTDTYTGSTYYLDIKADHTYEANMPESDVPDGGLGKGGAPAPETGTWSLEGSVFTTVSNPDKDTLKMNVTLDGGTLTAKFSMDTSFTEAGMTMSTKMDMTAKLVK